MPSTRRLPGLGPARPGHVAFCVIAILLALAGAASAYHLSAGARGAAGLTSEEDPTEPSVPETMHERGIRTDCPDNGLDTDAMLGQDAFCGALAYHEGTGYEQTGPRDQQLRSDAIDTFDVVYAQYVGTYGLGTCAPWCFPGGEPVYRGGHDAGAMLGLTPDGQAAYEEDQGWQRYGGALSAPHALATLQAETGAWEANGWMQPTPDQRFVGFLFDEEGHAIDDDRLQQIVAQADLPAQATPRVCGFTPDADLSTPDADPGCEVGFTWEQGTQNDGEACSSPTYVCPATGPAWQAQITCSAALPGCSQTPSTGSPGEDPSASTNDYDVWHWVVAPTPSACGGAQEPGFAVDPDGGQAFLAHDLDVYTPAATAADRQDTPLVEQAARRAAEDTVSLLPGQDLPEGSPEQATLVAKQDRIEPDTPGDTSQSHIHVDRDAHDPCRQIADDSEDPAFVDPWVDVIDASVYRNFWLDSILGVDPWLEGLERRSYQSPPVTSVFGDANDAYLTAEEDQDASNRPGPWLYSAGGQLGVFTDKDDDGRYDQAPNSRLFDAIEDVGAYPLFWDVRVDQGTIDEEAGCRIGADGPRLSAAMDEAGYGPRTGLAMVIYKTQPTVLYDWRTSQAFEQPRTEHAFVLLSQSLRAQREDPAVQDTLQAALDRLPADLSLGDDAVVFPGDQTPPASDFYEQCGYPTGGFHTSWTFAHAAHTNANATIVTAYQLDNRAEDGQLGQAGPIPAFRPDGQAHAFESGISRWFDVDPIDGDPDRHRDECSAPPHPGDRC